MEKQQVEKSRMKKLICIFFILLPGIIFPQSPGQWTWVNGPSTSGSPGFFGTIGVPAANVVPPSIYEGCEWTDQNYNFWVFGGAAISGENSALFKYEIATNNWTWIKGSSTTTQPGIYGVKGIPAAANTPGARGWGTMTWADKLGNLWLFGGYGYDVSGSFGELSDLWKYTIATNEWTWMAGPNTANPIGVYGTLGVPSAANFPPPRSEHNACWTDSQNNLWLYGGMSSSTLITYGDLWKFDVSVNQWVWMDGTATTGTAPNYGTQGVEVPSNNPGGRFSYTKFVDSQDNLYFFGAGTVYTSSLVTDVWKYSISTQNWTWVGGQQTPNNPGNYVAHCDTVNPNLPSSKFEIRASWPDACGFFFMGGFDYNTSASLNDLWYYSTDDNKFTWVSGGLSSGGVWGTQGVAAPANIPSGRGGALSFYDATGNLWLFGGMDLSGNRYNDLWKYSPDPACVPFCDGSIFNPGIANFSGSGQGCVPVTVTFNNNFNSGTSYLWDFGDGATSTSVDPSHTYTVPGVYDVTCIVTNAQGADTVVHTNAVLVGGIPVAAFSISTDSICSGQSIAFTNSTSWLGPAGSFSWQFGDGQADTQSDPVHTYTVGATTATTCNVVLIAADSLGICTDTVLQPVVIFPWPDMEITATPDTGCEALTVNFSSGLSINSIETFWNFGDGDTSSLANPTHIYNEGIYSVSLSGENILGCPDTASKTMTVFPRASASFTAAPLAGCVPLNVTFTNTSTDFQSLYWFFADDSSNCTDTLCSHVYPAEGTYPVYLVAYTEHGCNDTLNSSVMILEECELLNIPNVFTPNGDGSNDFFTVFVQDYAAYEITILDRWGLKMFESTNTAVHWNGSKMNTGGKCPDGTYYYLVRVKSFKGEEKVFNGFLGLYR
jgi:gliding motility-associated-like protein